MNFDKKCNLLIIGDATVGKTCILRRFAQDKFTSNYISTVGIDFFTKDVILDDKKNTHKNMGYCRSRKI